MFSLKSTTTLPASVSVFVNYCAIVDWPGQKTATTPSAIYLFLFMNHLFNLLFTASSFVNDQRTSSPAPASPIAGFKFVPYNMKNPMLYLFQDDPVSP